MARPDSVVLGAAVLAVASAAVAVGAAAGLPDLRGRGVLDGVVAGILVVCAVRAGRAPDRTRRGFWLTLTPAFALLALSYAASAASEVGMWGAGGVVGVVALLAAYPFMLGALCVRAVSEEGVEGGLATFLDLAVVVTALVAACLPLLTIPLVRSGNTQALGDAVTWAANVGLLAGGLWVLFRLPASRDPRGMALLVGALGVFCGLTIIQVVWQLRPGGGPLPWWLVTGFGIGYLMVASSPRLDCALEAGSTSARPGPTPMRGLLPHLALALLGALWVAALLLGRDLRVLGSGLAIVSLLVVGRQLILLREYRSVLCQERRRVRELTVTQQVARVLAATLDLDAVMEEVVRAASEIVSVSGHPCVATILRIEGDVARSAAARDPLGVFSTAVREYPLDSHPVLREVAHTRCTHRGRLDTTEMGEATAALVRRAALSHFIVTPLEVEGAVFGLLTVAATAGEAGFDGVHLERLEVIRNLADLAIGNAQRYAREREAASTDPLTGLRNRRAFERTLEALPRNRFALLAIDVDNLKSINDEYGHEAGDVVLRSVATALRGLVRSGDVLARMGGDEFAALLHGSDAAEARAVAERMQQAMHAVSVPRGFARISVGYAAGDERSDARGVWRTADEALFRAKRGGRDRVEGSLVAGSAAPAHTRSLWVEILNQILDSHSIGVAFQPIVRMEDRSVFGFEALARPSPAHPEAGVEDLFVAAQSVGALRDLDWLCRRMAVSRSQAIPAGVPLFVNISSAALLDPVHSVDQMLLLCHSAGRRPADVVLEMSERETIPDLRRLRQVVAAYREHGFRFAVDDVGDGHSTLEVLSTALPEFVKVARKLVVNAHEGGAAAAIHAAVEFVRMTGACVVAEGVETEEQARLVTDLGVALGQGWLLGRPTASPRAVHRAAQVAV